MSHFDVLGMLSATASLGLVLLWDVDSGLTQIDKYLYSSEDFIKVFFVVAYTCIPLKQCLANEFLKDHMLICI